MPMRTFRYAANRRRAENTSNARVANGADAATARRGTVQADAIAKAFILRVARRRASVAVFKAATARRGTVQAIAIAKTFILPIARRRASVAVFKAAIVAKSF